ncbi:MAG: hypothetical protein IJH94_05475 [Clostridia bacterium]|nr:hypothetical protein [Clostridia bacterium]
MSVVLIFIRPIQRIWDLMSIISMIGFLIVNCRFLLKYMVSRKDKIAEFYVINGITFLIYGVASVVAYYFCGHLLYSMVYAHFRVFEVFNIKTLYSIYMSNVLVIVTMFVFGVLARRHMEFAMRVMGVADEVDTSELEKYYSGTEAVQNNQSIQVMSVEEMSENIINEIKEAQEAQKKTLEYAPDELWHNLERGDGSEIEYKTPDDPEDDYDEHDEVAANAENLHEAYSSDKLWEDIYDGQDKIENYDDEDDLPIQPEQTTAKVGIAESIKWHLKSLNKLMNIRNDYRRNEIMLRDINTRTRQGSNTHSLYDADNLWDGKFYQGTDESRVPERVIDFDETPGRIENNEELDQYDSERLWDVRANDTIEVDGDKDNENHDDPNETYDVDSLWQSEFSRGREKAYFDEMGEEIVETTQNPNEDYDVDSLWSKDIKQGRG